MSAMVRASCLTVEMAAAVERQWRLKRGNTERALAQTQDAEGGLEFGLGSMERN